MYICDARNIPHDELMKLSKKCTIQLVPRGHQFYRRGDVADKFYIIAHGSVHVISTYCYLHTSNNIYNAMYG
jgi:hypothetical protein